MPQEDGGLDPTLVEDRRSDQLLSEFLGLRGSELCPVFGFARNTYYMLALQVVVGYLVLKLCVLLYAYLEPDGGDADARRAAQADEQPAGASPRQRGSSPRRLLRATAPEEPPPRARVPASRPAPGRAEAEDDDPRRVFDTARAWASSPHATLPGGKALSSAEKLYLYGCFKQATDGDCVGSYPWTEEARAQSEWQAWHSQKGTSRAEAMRRYGAKLDEIAPHWREQAGLTFRDRLARGPPPEPHAAAAPLESHQGDRWPPLGEDEPDEDQKIQALSDEFHERLAKILEDRRQKELLELQKEMRKASMDSMVPAADSSQDEPVQLEAGCSLPCQEEEPSRPSMAPVVYWVWQAVMAIILLSLMAANMIGSEGRSLDKMRGASTWSHYNLFIFAFINSGMLPTAARALAHVAASAPARRRHGSYTSLGGDGSRLLEAEPGERADPREVAEMHRRLAFVVCPLALPCAAAVLTHVVPFCFCYPWVFVLTGLLALGLVWLTRFLAALFKASPGHEQEAVSLLLQVVFCLFAHSSVPVMMRVYGGEWRHGGYSNQLFSRVFRGEFERHDCTWFSFTYGVDLMLRWT